MFKKIDDHFNTPEGLMQMMVILTAVSTVAALALWDDIAGRDWTKAVISGVSFLVLTFLLSRVMVFVKRRLETTDPEAIKAAQAEVADNFSRWSMANEIGEKIDWEHFGRIVECYSPLDDDEERA
jgi:hypothetical protein